MFIRYIKEKLAKKRARKIFQEYSYEVHSFNLPEDGNIEFANWKNPLIKPKIITQSEINFFKQFIPAGSLAIDIGANIGDTTVPMAVAAGKDGLVLGFDPNPHVFKILEANAALNKNKTNIISLPFAITAEDGEFFYNSSEASFSNGGITEIPSGYHGSFSLSQKIRGINLEKYLEKNYPEWLGKLSFIKIDTEGLDKEIIKSIHPLIEKYKPVIISECFTKLTKDERTDLFKSVADKGYKLFYFHDFQEGTKTAPLSASDMGKWPHFNFYAIPADKAKQD